MSLREYDRKRRFDTTPEPRSEGSATKAGRPIFVVQLHHASRRHYDFRLQVGDTLKSWACPKGPSYDPTVKRLAVEVEDHPISYATFQGDIPADAYGGGHVDTFDSGVWSTRYDPEAQLEKGHLRFELFGTRLKGSWHLVRSGKPARQPQWFLMHDQDAYASDVEADDLLDAHMIASTRAAAGRSGGAREVAATLDTRRRKKVPSATHRASKAGKLAAAAEGARKARPSGDFFKPELATLRENPPRGEQWLHEVKWDGYRIVATVAGGEVRLWSRNGLSWSDKIPDIRQAVEALGLDSARLDGELIALDADGQADFNALQKTLSGEASAPLAYMLFDLPFLEGYDLSGTPLHARKAILEALLEDAPAHLSYSSHVTGNGEQVFAMASERKLEGILSKRIESHYRAGRGGDWLKIKRVDADEFAVVGYTAPRGGRQGFGALLLARPAPGGGWHFVGQVGSGFSHRQLADLSRTLATGGGDKPTVRNPGDAPRGVKWIEPTAVAEVNYRGIGNQGLLRQPSLKAMRPDKTPADLRDSDRAPPGPPVTRRKVAAHRAATAREPAGITITHPDRVVYPDDGYTKQDVADYYRAVMPWFLPGVIDRPTSIIRYPEGIAKPAFFQKHVPSGGLKYVGNVKLKEETGAAAIYLYPQSADSVMELVQYGTLEFHPWGARADTPDLADRVVFDLDPGPDVAWERVVAAARLVRKLLADLGLQSFLRTTGGKGLHVVVPLDPPSDWATVKQFAQGFADALAGTHPLEFVAVSTKSRRNQKIFVDYLRNGRGATAVASYSLRGRPGAPVAVPLRWDELGKIRSGAQFDIRSVPARLKRLRKDPWAGIDTVRQSLDKVVGKLGGA